MGERPSGRSDGDGGCDGYHMNGRGGGAARWMGDLNPGEGFGGLVSDPVQGLGIPFMIVGPILCAMCIVIYVIVSLATPRPEPEKLKNLCWEHPIKAITYGRITGIGDPRIIAAFLFAVMVVLYYVFRS